MEYLFLVKSTVDAGAYYDSLVDNTSTLGCSGTTSGGDNVTLTGTGITCTPAFPAVSFGGTNAVVTSCGSTTVNTTTPAHTPGSVTVTLTNSGAAASNGLTYTYLDLTRPTFTGMSVAGSVVTVTYSEPVCRTAAFIPGDWQVSNVSANTTDTLTGDNTPVCDATASNAVTTANLFLTTPMPPGAFVEVDLLESGAAGQNQHIRDVTGNTIKAPQGQTASAGTVPSTAPTISSASSCAGRMSTLT